MESAAYRDFKTTRGFSYYSISPPARSWHAYNIVLYGSPSTSYDWKNQVEFFKKKGYGLLVPDMLGYGGSDKPTDTEAYRIRLLGNDTVEIFDNEKLSDVVIIGQIAYYHPDRFVAFGMLAASYMPPDPKFNYKELNARMEKTFGYPLVGYWEHFSSSDAPRIIAEHAPYLTDEEIVEHKKNLLQSGLTSLLFWYKAMLYNHTPDIEIDPDSERIVLKKPIFFGATLQDYICGKATTQILCPKSRIVDFDTDHWVMWAEFDELYKEILGWIKRDVEGTTTVFS